ncbi:MAG: hypothetical protein OHK0035_18700 [Cyanobacteria bacterium J069]
MTERGVVAVRERGEGGEGETGCISITPSLQHSIASSRHHAITQLHSAPQALQGLAQHREWDWAGQEGS